VFTITSTKVPGSAKPATPTTSLTRTVIARLPAGTIADRPPLVPMGASRASSTGSPRCTVPVTTRPCSFSTSVNTPGGWFDCGQSTMRTISGVMAEPN
jgi:hypothetical protein